MQQVHDDNPAATSPRLASGQLVREINRDIILELIRFHQPVARVELARLSGLMRTTVSRIVEQLADETWIREGELIRGPRGRPSTMISMNEDLVTVAVGVNFSSADLAVIDINGNILSEEVITGDFSDPAAITKEAAKRIARLQKQFVTRFVKGVGVSFPGRVDPETGEIRLSAHLPWKGFHLRAELQKRTGLMVEIENDANACLISELWHGRLNGEQDVVLVSVGGGVGAAIFSGGHLLTGSDGLAGEFGHLSIDPSGPQCPCGQRGCWETFASSAAAIAMYKRKHKSADVKSHFDLHERAEKGDQDALDAIAKQAHALGRGLRLITTTLSPSLILFIGNFTASWDLVRPIMEQEMAARTFAGPAPRLRMAGDAKTARLTGCAAMLLQRRAKYQHFIGNAV